MSFVSTSFYRSIFSFSASLADQIFQCTHSVPDIYVSFVHFSYFTDFIHFSFFTFAQLLFIYIVSFHFE